MIKPTSLFIIVLNLLFLSCVQSNEKKKVITTPKDIVKIAFEKKEQERKEKRKQLEEGWTRDSLYLDKILNDAVSIVYQNINQGRFKKKYVETMPDSSYQITVNIESDFYFTKAHPHVIIHRNAPGSMYIDIFSNKGRKLTKVISHEQSPYTYTNDTIRDINGDGLKDFVVNWYGSTGCCLKAFSDIYLLQTDQKSFSNSFEFINPTFSPKEKIIRGVCYGHPGETEMYKYKWKGLTVDTLEYIYYEENNKGEKTGKIISSDKISESEKPKKMTKLNFIPAEYKKIQGYDWFTNNL